MWASSLVFVATVSVALAQSTTTPASTSDIQASLRNSGLGNFANLLPTIGGSPAGQNTLAEIANGQPQTIVAPNDAAVAGLPQSILGNSNALTNMLNYHVLPGTINAPPTNPPTAMLNSIAPVSVFPNTTVARTLLTDVGSVALEGGNKAQALAWDIGQDGNIHFLNQRTDTSVVNITKFGNLSVWTVNNFLQIPPNLAKVVPTGDFSLSGFNDILKTVQTPIFKDSFNAECNVSLFEAFDTGFHGYTLFAPNTSAVQAAKDGFKKLSDVQLQNLLYNHFLNSTTLYSPLLANLNSITAAGQTLSFSVNATGRFVTDVSSNTTARIVQPDVLLPNGVIHVIDRVIFDKGSNFAVASSALAAATSAAALAEPSQTAPIGFSATVAFSSPSGTPGDNSSLSSPSGSPNGNSSLSSPSGSTSGDSTSASPALNGDISGARAVADVVWGMLVAAVGVVAGSVFVFA